MKANVPIVEIAERYLKVKRRGKNFVALCPFHSERTPSFTMNPRTNKYRCFGCGIYGSQIDLYAHFNELSFVDAAKLLAKEYAIVQQNETVQEKNERAFKNELANAVHQKKHELFLELIWILDNLKMVRRSVKNMSQVEALEQYYHLEVILEYLLDLLTNGELNEEELLDLVIYIHNLIEKGRRSCY
ncbi:hypothetical protein BKP45_04850 [Anaerobacillus alkalidiazotrophicus]|uniref:Zinc finger CHC2-type domain-containing protein n=1 Tax=Anaerobacillus alkalidiazotrophicus TaxID=472963 RepID=A0A1S2MB71_9BACI|nr:CHC2 zinc finger domain-containing protein [Anaerobacillus alkalidiazotrophicus]OIJ22008.1 hypothetical protein BKP45_04850 [Anaerobacillus alkalidiazotrophicus]